MILSLILHHQFVFLNELTGPKHGIYGERSVEMALIMTVEVYGSAQLCSPDALPVHRRSTECSGGAPAEHPDRIRANPLLFGELYLMPYYWIFMISDFSSWVKGYGNIHHYSCNINIAQFILQFT